MLSAPTRRSHIAAKYAIPRIEKESSSYAVNQLRGELHTSWNCGVRKWDCRPSPNQGELMGSARPPAMKRSHPHTAKNDLGVGSPRCTATTEIQPSVGKRFWSNDASLRHIAATVWIDTDPEWDDAKRSTFAEPWVAYAAWLVGSCSGVGLGTKETEHVSPLGATSPRFRRSKMLERLQRGRPTRLALSGRLD